MESIEKRIEKDPAVAHAVNEAVPTNDGGGRAPSKYEKGRRADEIARRSHHKKPQSSGVGESKTFNAPEGTFEETLDWSALTVNGQPIPEHLWQRIPYKMTDQGTEEANEGKQERRAEVLREAPLSSRGTAELLDVMSDRSIEQSVEQFRESMELMEQEDPLGVLMKRHTPEGHRGLMMSDRRVAQIGMRRGPLDYEPVLIEKDGALVRVQHGGMFLASVPEPLAREVERLQAKRNRDLTTDAVATVQNLSEQVMSDAGIKRQNRRGDLPEGGIEFLEGGEGGMVTGEIGRTFKG